MCKYIHLPALVDCMTLVLVDVTPLTYNIILHVIVMLHVIQVYVFILYINASSSELAVHVFLQ